METEGFGESVSPPCVVGSVPKFGYTVFNHTIRNLKLGRLALGFFLRHEYQGSQEITGGAEGIRTPDPLNAMQDPVDINGTLQNGSFPFTLPPRGVGFYATDGEGEPVTGWVKVETDLPLGGTILFDGDLEVAGVGSVEPAGRLLVPIESSTSDGVQTGVALANPTTSIVDIMLTLRGDDGEPVPGGSTSIPLPAHGQVARFPEQIFPGQDIDFSDFRGTLEVSTSVPIAGMAVRVSPGEIATLPVTRMH